MDIVSSIAVLEKRHNNEGPVIQYVRAKKFFGNDLNGSNKGM